MNDLPSNALYAPRVETALRGLGITLCRPPAPKKGATPEEVSRALSYLGLLSYPAQVKAAICFMFVGFIRQGNLAPRAVGAFDATRHLTRDDISRHAKGLLVRLKWTKTMQSSCTPTSVCLPQIPGSPLCPTAAYVALLQVDPTSSPGQPFVRYLDGNPITAAYLTAQWRTLIWAAGLDPAGFSLHSLRRGGAHFALHRGGVLLTDVMAHGTWRSDAVHAYIRPDTYQETSVHRAFQNIAL